MGGVSWSARNRHHGERPTAVRDLQLTGPVQSLGNRCTRQRLGRAGSLTRRVKVERRRIRAGIRCKKIEVQTGRQGPGGYDSLDHGARLEHTLDKSEEIETPILYGGVR